MIQYAFCISKNVQAKTILLDETLGGTLAAGLHNQNIGGSKSVGSSTLSGVGFDGDSLGGTDDCEF